MKLRGAFICLSIAVQNMCYGQYAGSKTDLVEDIPSYGALCAIKKAYQLTDVSFTPLDSIRANQSKKYDRNKEYTGMIYSSVKEIDTYVGLDVSLHTFMTALHNPQSVLYTENISKRPYHGINCGAFYGVVCNTFVSYALGLTIPLNTYEFPTAPNMMLVDDQSSEGVRLADVVCKKGHVMLVTRIWRERQGGKTIELELSEAVRTGCRRSIISGKELDARIVLGEWCLCRYKDLEQNTYMALTDFVAVDDEVLVPYTYNDDICTNRGDKACFVSGDTVPLRLREGYKTLEIYKDSALYQKIKIRERADFQLADLPYGDYRARVVNGSRKSDFTSWKVVDVQVNVNAKEGLVSFRSSNSTPVYLEFCSISGVRPAGGVFEFSEETIRRGLVDVSSFRLPKSQGKNEMYVKVHFECDYGRVINKPIRWK